LWKLDTDRGQARQEVLLTVVHEEGGAASLPPQEAGGHPEGAGAWPQGGEGIQGAEQGGGAVRTMRIDHHGDGERLLSWLSIKRNVRAIR